MYDLDYIKIYDKIHVYKNMFKNIDKMLDDLKNINDEEIKSFGKWEQWYTFGRQRPISGSNNSNDILTKYVKDLENVLKTVTDHYMNFYEMDQQDILMMNGHLCEYSPVVNGDERTLMTMTYHVDFQQEKIGRPGIFHYVTCNMYLNDDYKDGQICFSVNDDKFDYKPKAGDIVVFPSTPPYYHGVRKTLQSEKYFFRTFIMKNYPASQEWIDGQEKYGSEIWNEIQLKKEKEERVKYIKHQDYQQSTLKVNV